MDQVITNLRKTPLLLDGIVLELLRKYFQQQEDYRYLPLDKVQSKLVIEPSYLWSPESCQNRPGVFVKLGNISYGNPRLGMDDLYGNNLTPPFNVPDGTLREYAIMAAVDIAVHNVSKLPGEAKILAGLTSDLLLAFAPRIRRDFAFMRFAVTGIGEIGKLEESSEFWTIPVLISAGFAETWVLEQEALRLNEVYLNFMEEIGWSPSPGQA